MSFYVYILTNKTGSVLYTGVTRDLPARVFQHKQKMVDGFTKRYNVDRLVYYEVSDAAMPAFEREKAIKGGSRKRKLALIASMNPPPRCEPSTAGRGEAIPVPAAAGAPPQLPRQPVAMARIQAKQAC